MKKHHLIPLLAGCLIGLCALSACQNGQSGGTETTDSDTTAADVTVAETVADTTETGTEPVETATDTAESTEDTEPSDTETETLAPRYDYMGADVSADVTIDRSVYTDMQLTLPAYLTVTDQDVKDYINYILFDYREADNDGSEVTDQPLKLGDDAFIYYKGIIDGEAFEGGSNWDDEEPYQLGLGSGEFIPGFEEGLVGIIPANATKETPVELHVTFPADYDESMAGKEAVFYVAVEYAVPYTLPTYDRDFVENVLMYEPQHNYYASEKAFLAEYEAGVRAELEDMMAEDIEYAKIDALWSYLVETATCRNHPQLELDYYLNSYISEIEYYYEYYVAYGGTSFTETYPTMDDFAKLYTGVGTDGDWRAELESICLDLVSKDMICHAIAELEGMEEVTDEELNAEIDYWVDYYSGYMSAEEVVASMGTDSLRESAFIEKMQAWLLEQATFTIEVA